MWALVREGEAGDELAAVLVFVRGLLHHDDHETGIGLAWRLLAAIDEGYDCLLDPWDVARCGDRELRGLGPVLIAMAQSPADSLSCPVNPYHPTFRSGEPVTNTWLGRPPAPSDDWNPPQWLLHDRITDDSKIVIPNANFALHHVEMQHYAAPGLSDLEGEWQITPDWGAGPHSSSVVPGCPSTAATPCRR